MKKVIVLLVLLCLCLPARASMYSWIWADDNQATGVRLGADLNEKVEAGISALFWPDDTDPHVWGVYGKYSYPDLVQIPNPVLAEWLPDMISGTPYIGAKFDLNLQTEENTVGPIAGIVFNDVLFMEYQYQSFQPQTTAVNSKIIFGLRIKF